MAVKKKFCNRCLENRYGILTFGANTEEKHVETETKGKKQKKESTEDEDNYTEIDGLWLCPYCEGICICSTCMQKRGLNPMGTNLPKLKKEIEGKFDSIYAYLIYQRDQKRDPQDQTKTSVAINTDTSEKSAKRKGDEDVDSQPAKKKTKQTTTKGTIDSYLQEEVKKENKETHNLEPEDFDIEVECPDLDV